MTPTGQPANEDAADALAQSERRFRALTEKASELLAIADAAGNVTYESPNQTAVLGYATGELLGRSVFDLLHPDDRVKALAALQEVVAGSGASYQIEVRVKPKEGDWRWLDIIGTNLLNDPAVNGIVLNCRDITERKVAEAALRESQQQNEFLAGLIRTSSQPVVVAYPDGRLGLVNRAYEELTGYSADELRTVSWATTLTPPEWREMTRAKYAELERTGRPVRYEKEYIRKDGTRVPIELLVHLVTDAKGQPQYYYAFLTDITERKKAEESLQQSEERYRLLADAVPHLAWRCDAAGLTIDCNRRWYEYTGQTPEEVRGTGWMQVLHPDDLQRVMQRVKDDVAGGELYQTEYRLRRASDGAYRWHLARALPMRDAGGQIVGWFGSAADVEDQKELEQSLQYRLALEQLLAALSTSLLNVSAARLDATINDVLAHIGQLMGADRCFLFHITDDYAIADNTHEWCATGVHPQIANLRSVPTAEFPWLRKQLLKGEPVYIRRAADLPAQATGTRRLMEAGRVQSVIIVPIRRAGRITGLIGCDAVTAERHWPDEDVRLLRTVGELLTDAEIRCRAEDALRASEEQYRRLVENLKGHHFIYRHDTQGVFTYLSESITAVLGHTPAEFMTHYSQYMTDHPANQIVKQHTDLSIQGIPQPPYEVNVWHKDGTDRWLEVQEVPIVSSSGEVVAVEGVAQDITARKRAEEALRESEMRYRTLFGQAADIIVLIDPDTLGFVDFNDQACRQLGYSREEFAKLRIPDLDVVESATETKDHVKKIIATGTDVFETKHKTKRGDILDIEIRSSPVRLGARTFLLAVWRDITARKQAEQALRESEARLRLTTGAGNVGLWDWDLRTDRVYYSPEWKYQIGYRDDEISSRLEEWQSRVHPDDLKPTLQKVRGFLASPQGRHEVEFRFRHKNGSYRWIYTIADALRDADGKVVRMLGCHIDITERKQAEQALLESEERYRLLADNVDDIVMLNDTRGGRIYVSPSYFRRTGWTMEELRSTDWRALIHPDDLPLVERTHAANLEGKRTVIENRVHCRDGRWMWAETHCKPLFDAEGKVHQLLVWSHDITERKRAEEVVAASERRFRALVERGVGSITVLDETGKVVYDAPTIDTLIGFEPEEMIGKSIFDFLHPDDRAKAEAKFRRLLGMPDKTLRDEFRVQAKDGSFHILEVNATNQLQDPAVRGIVLNTSDITERKQAEQALRENEERFRTMAESIPQHVTVYDAHGRPEYANRQRADYTGITLEQAQTAGGWEEAIHSDDRSLLNQTWKQSMKCGTPFVCEYRLRCAADNQYRWFLARATPLKDQQGQAIKWFVTATDITERKRMEDVLRENEEQFRTLAEALPHQVWGFDGNGKPQYANQQRIEYAGLTLEQAQAAGGWWEVIHPDERAMVMQVWKQAVKSHKPFQCEYRLRRAADGQYRWFLGRGVPIKNQQGQVVQWFGTATDIDEQKHLEELLDQGVKERTAQLQEEILRRHRLEQQILEVVEREQHRIGQDLHDSVGQVLTGAKFLSSSLSHRLARAKTPGAFTAARISRELDKALDEVRAIARGLHPVRTDSESLMAALHELASSTTRIFEVHCRFECPQPVLIHDHIAAIHLYRIAQEAVSNAARHANAQQIHISLRRGDDEIQLRIRDNGRGLPSRTRRRAGMGLEIMKHRASVIGATVTISRAKNGGTIVTCLLPHQQKGASHDG